jgi:DNA-binding NtrC family response regulator
MAENARVLVVDDEASLRLLLSKELAREGYEVDTVSDGTEALKRLAENRYHVVLLDIVLPGMDGVSVLRRIKKDGLGTQVIMLTGNATVENAVESMKLGAFEYIRKPYALTELVAHLERAVEFGRSQLGIEFLRQELRRSGHRGGLIGKSRAIADLRRLIERVATTQSIALVYGESGTGKEVVARSIHESSDRGKNQFVAINCASFSETLLESELFGHEKGAFTDAKVQKRGLAEVADGGTLFLDEVGEIPVRFQSKLLRFLETSEIRRVGGTRDIKLNARILCATNKPLEELVERGQFRDDLYYRLNVLSVSVPPLREHAEDIPLLVENFLEQLGFHKRFDQGALQVLGSYHWPGNVRELKNVVERACIMSPRDTITADDIAFLRLNAPSSSGPTAPEDAAEEGGVPVSLQEVERRHIVRVLEYVGGHKGRAAELLRINPKTLYNKIRAYGIRHAYR